MAFLGFDGTRTQAPASSVAKIGIRSPDSRRFSPCEETMNWSPENRNASTRYVPHRR